MLLKVSALLAVALIALPVSADSRMQPYCELYRDTLEDVVYDHRRGYPDYSESMHASDRLRQDAAFIFQQRKSFDFHSWIRQRYQTCWEKIPEGPPIEPRGKK